MDVRIAPVHDVANDRPEAILAQGMAENAAAQKAQRFNRIQVLDADRIAVLETEARPGGIRKNGFVATDKVRRHGEEGGNDLVSMRAQENARLRGKSFGTANGSTTVKKHNRF